MKTKVEKLYKIVFIHLGKVYEIYSRGVTSSGLYGFVEVSELVFDSASSMVVDPVEEKLHEEFSSVEILHLPIQSVLRVEQVRKRGQCVIRDQKTGEKVTPFPVHK
ncbi:MAG: DUF1820 family protein [Xanthomonadales bacterium]|nr:DUF1820 family protein [Xanthomonadales bacterium]